jgi:DNA-binding NarL/FixJ family response regulator
LRPEGVVRLAALRRRQGRIDEAAALLQQVEGYPPALVERAALALDSGDHPAAARLARRAVEHGGGASDPSQHAAIELLVRACVALGQRETAARALEGMGTAGAAHDVAGPARALNATARGVLLAANGEHPEAIAALGEAVEHFALGGAPFDAARVRIDLAGALRGSGEKSAALREAKHAETALRTLGAEVEVRRAADLVRKLEDELPNPATRSDGLTARELQVLRLLADGQSNKEIAVRLHVSEFTIKRHVANILTRLDLPSRAAAAAYAVRKQIR